MYSIAVVECSCWGFKVLHLKWAGGNISQNITPFAPLLNHVISIMLNVHRQHNCNVFNFSFEHSVFKLRTEKLTERRSYHLSTNRMVRSIYWTYPRDPQYLVTLNIQK